VIITRKPWTIYDVDLLGAATVIALAAAAWWLAVMPWQQTWARSRELAAQHAALQAGLRGDVTELERFQQQLKQLENTVTAQAAEVPRADSVSDLLRRMTDLAKDAELELINVAPRPATAQGAYLVSDIEVTGRGRSHDFIRFLDQLAQGNPYQALRACSITRPASGERSTCELVWTIRLYVLPSVASSSGGRP
jgi:Tfp pilus assembly protein PilO